MAQKALVHKQFNSPLGLYSDNNIKETLNRELKTLSNGTVGIDFANDPVVGGNSTGKPANLANSAVLRMLQEEEEQRRQGNNPGYRTVAWPPPHEAHLRQPSQEKQHLYTPQVQEQPRAVSQPRYQPQYQNQSSYDHQPQTMQRQQPAWRQNSVPSFTQKPVYQPPGDELAYHQTYPQGTPVYQGGYNDAPQVTQIPVQVERSQPAQPGGYSGGYSPAQSGYQQSQPQQQQPLYQQQQPQQQFKPRQANWNKKPVPTTVSFSGGIAVEKPVPKPNNDYYFTQQQRFYNNDDDTTINQPRAGSLQRNYQQQQQQQQPEMHSRQRFDSQSSLPRSGSSGFGHQQQQQQGGYPHGGGQQQPSWAHNAQPVYNSYNNNPAPSYDSPQYPATVSYQSTAYNQPPAYSPQSPAPQYQQQQHYQAPSPARGGYGQPMNSAQGQGQQQQQQTQQPYNYRQPSPASGMVTLRQSTPISQKPVPVYQSQPPVSSFNATRDGNWRGDMKWPPEECKKQAAIENEERLKLAAGPACRPRRGNKDYSEFFARHALNTVYPGYRIPPGTQHIGYD